MKNSILIIFLFFSSLILLGQNVNRNYVSHLQEGKSFKVETNDGTYVFLPYSESILETSFIPKGESFDTNSHAVILNPNRVSTTYEDLTNQVIYKTSGISVVIQKKPFKITYLYKEKELISEKLGYVKNDSLETIQFNITKDEILYGGGARALGMNRRGYRLQLYNRAHYGYETRSELMNYTLPIVISSKQYMIHFDNAPVGFLDLDSKRDNTIAYETISGRKTYQIIAGDSWYDIVDHYTDLTGKQSMLPRWALGNFSSRFGYHSQQETEATINKFIQEKIPVDAIILDLYWFGKDIKGTMGNLEVFRDSFPDFEGMVNRLKQKGVKTITITEPFILTSSNRWQEAVDKDILAKDSIGNPFTYDFYFGNTGLIDIYKPEAENWFWNIYKDLANKNVAGIWGDLGEPEVHPSNLIHATGTADEVHNIYGHDWARLIYEGYQRDFPNQRPFILMRAGYSGSQRYGMIPWSGDVNRTWGGLQSQPEIALQMSMQGLAYMHSDLGGFAGANLDDELYVRWLQYGVFQPIFRPHAQEEVPSEPIFRSSKAKALAKKAIELRYKLLPYNYNLVYENSQFGKPLMRPLFFEESDNNALYDYSKTYLWGNDILVSPVLQPYIKNQEVYFPKNSVWFNFYTDEKIQGGITKTIKLEESSIPTFIKAGAFIPMINTIQNTKAYTPDRFQLHYYFDNSISSSNRNFYNDDGLDAKAIDNKDYEILQFQSKSNTKWLEIALDAKFSKPAYQKEKEIQLVIHNVDWFPSKVKLNKKKVQFDFDKKNQQLKIPVTWNTSKSITIRIKK